MPGNRPPPSSSDLPSRAAIDPMAPIVYKLCSAAEWAAAEASGHYTGSADDVRDGFIHFSTAGQLAGTAAKYFRHRSDLVLVAVKTDALGQALWWEPSRGDMLFPHLYAALDTTAVLWAKPIDLDPDGLPRLPENLA